MALKTWLKKERLLWHKHFIPSLIAGLALAAVTLVFKFTLSNVILFASIGASAVILTNAHSHHLTTLRITLESYLIAILISLGLYYLNSLIKLPLPFNLFLVVFLVGILLFLFNSFHPPAISIGTAFIILERTVLDLIYLLITVMILFTIIRFLTYTISPHLSVKEFYKEFKKVI